MNKERYCKCHLGNQSVNAIIIFEVYLKGLKYQDGNQDKRRSTV